MLVSNLSKIDNSACVAQKRQMAKAKDFDSPAAVAGYLTKAFGTGDSALIAQALGIVVRMKG
jgi:DNA-binding phage protein